MSCSNTWLMCERKHMIHMWHSEKLNLWCVLRNLKCYLTSVLITTTLSTGSKRFFSMVKSMSNRPELKKQNSYQADAGVIREPVTFRGRRIQKMRSVLSVNSTCRSARIFPMYLRAMDMRRRDDRYLKCCLFLLFLVSL